MYDQIKMWWLRIQELLSVDGGLYIDAMCLVMIVRLVAPLFGYSPMTASEAGIWAATITTYGFSKGKKND